VHPDDAKPTTSVAAAVALVRLASEHPSATLVCLGPLTNVAIALKIDPTFAFRRISNFHGDPEAAAIVLHKLAEHLVIVPWEAFFLEGAKHEKEVDFHAHLEYDTELASFLRTATSTGRAAMEKNGRQFSYCDEIAVATAIDMDKVVRKTVQLRVNVELSGTYSR
ncbi:unnamed protein product, partial [Nippostrongylus brasiliensis]|uniref:IU_nuc_hydro domain-containing protein n=1 Tax=Nippostrongylus brasiliensis TaxID=27835 RepID=A0A0N4XK24_NIPBR